MKCRIIGGYGRTPVDRSILSSESALRADSDGPCLTLAEVPHFEDEVLSFKLTKIFSQPVLNKREIISEQDFRAVFPQSHSGGSTK